MQLNNSLKKFLIKTAIFLAIGISLMLFIQLYFRNTLFFKSYLDIPKDFSIEPPNYRTIFINSLFVGFIAFMILSYEKLKKIKEFRFKKIQLVYAILPVFFLVLQYGLKFLIHENLGFFMQMPFFWGLVRMAINILFAASLALAVYGADTIIYFLREYRKEILIFSALSIGFFMITLLFQNLWLVFSTAISNIIYHFFRLFSKDVTYTPYVPSASMSEGGGPSIGIGSFSAIIGKPCSGIDSFLFFTAIYILIIIVDHKRMKKMPMITGYFLGAIGMFLTNMIRLLLLFMVGAYINKEFAIGLFHSNIGWILFVIYFYIFFSVAKEVYLQILIWISLYQVICGIAWHWTFCREIYKSA